MSCFGGLSEVKLADAVIQAVIDQMRCKVEDKINEKFKDYRAVIFRTQVVAGLNYFVKVHTEDKKYLHLRLFSPLPCNGMDVELHGVEYPKSETDELKYFDCN
ncbi:hypothetical protein HELRODRAFT_70492 [Helobdella robusta]|uniref:Cystatin domain-containing protein n=1 Tax=Helobdella robusta TaxID=6412 RepID=T1G071_HELRO|nr:hypothetical protein HELRODRAFT_70492 [Helobdella robusta]ESN91479.1 hypothetical protein HELRODRAFT_70492 [Helobdella robusta]